MSKFFAYKRLTTKIPGTEAIEIELHCIEEDCRGKIEIEKVCEHTLVGSCSECGTRYRLIFKNEKKK